MSWLDRKGAELDEDPKKKHFWTGVLCGMLLVGFIQGAGSYFGWVIFVLIHGPNG